MFPPPVQISCRTSRNRINERHEEIFGTDGFSVVFYFSCCVVSRDSSAAKYPVLLSSANTSCALCANFRILQCSHECRHSLIVFLCLSLCRSHTVNSTISHTHFLNMCHVHTLSHTHTCTDSLAPDLISACSESLFEDKGFPRLRQAAGGKETRRRLAAE